MVPAPRPSLLLWLLIECAQIDGEHQQKHQHFTVVLGYTDDPMLEMNQI